MLYFPNEEVLLALVQLRCYWRAAQPQDPERLLDWCQCSSFAPCFVSEEAMQLEREEARYLTLVFGTSAGLEAVTRQKKLPGVDRWFGQNFEALVVDV